MSDDDSELRPHFDALRESEMRLAPPFEGVSRAAERPRMRRTRRLAMLAAAAAMLVATLAVLLDRPELTLRNGLGQGGNRPVRIEEMSRWQSPTASLMRAPTSPLLSTVPTAHSEIPPRIEVAQ